MKAANVKDEIAWDWMRPEVATIPVDAPLEEAIEKMKKMSVHHLIVMDGKKYEGILDARDCAGVWDKAARVRHVTRFGVPPIDEQTEVGTVVHFLVARGLTAVPLSRMGRVDGILTTTDLLRLMQAELSEGDGPGLLEKGKAFLAKPIIQSLSNLLGGAGL